MKKAAIKEKRNGAKNAKVFPAAAFCVLSAAALLNAGSFDKSAAGASTAQFLKMAVGARAAAMGEAYSALAGDASAVFWNPAAIIRVRKESYFFMHSPYLASSSYDYFGYVNNSGRVGSWGFAAQYFNAGSIKRTNLSGVETGEFTPYDMALSLAFSCYISGYRKDPERRFVLGANGKLVRSKILKADNTVSADIGILFPEMFSGNFVMALSAHNIMGSLRLDLEDYPLPLILRLGTVTKLSKYYLVTADITAPKDNVPYFSMGNELNIFIKDIVLSLRGGFNTRALFDVNGLRNISFGAGFKYDKYNLDYSFSLYGNLGKAHRISLGLNF